MFVGRGAAPSQVDGAAVGYVLIESGLTWGGYDPDFFNARHTRSGVSGITGICTPMAL
jgi:hypothetical protein